jgi:FAD/FMN-containing dehydrogenase
MCSWGCSLVSLSANLGMNIGRVRTLTHPAANHNIRLVVKSSGHDFLGRSVAPNSLSIWTQHLKSVQTHTSFRPQGCRTGGGGQVISRITAVTVGAGTPMYDVYRALDALNLTTVGGGAKSVSLGGFMTGAGHGLLSPTYGLSADQVLEVELVTAKGEIVTANACQNRDLFWAVRGVSLCCHLTAAYLVMVQVQVS